MFARCITRATRPGARALSTVSVDGASIDVRNIYCVGRNYVDHAHELGNEAPKEEPVIFMKSSSCVRGLAPEGLMPFPDESFHHELEVVLLINQPVPLGAQVGWEAVDAVALGLDLTRRGKQDELKAKKLPWVLAKVGAIQHKRAQLTRHAHSDFACAVELRRGRGHRALLEERRQFRPRRPELLSLRQRRQEAAGRGGPHDLQCPLFAHLPGRVRAARPGGPHLHRHARRRGAHAAGGRVQHGLGAWRTCRRAVRGHAVSEPVSESVSSLS
jgi:hypothetical protein